MGPASVCSSTRSEAGTPWPAAGSTDGTPRSERPAPPWPSGRPPLCCAVPGATERQTDTGRHGSLGRHSSLGRDGSGNGMTTGAVVPGVVLAEIRDTPLSVDEVVEAVRHPTADQVAHDLAARFAAEGRVVRLGVVHRTGHLTIGDIAVVAAVSAEHRREAFEVCHALIDEFKSTVPIWKHQTFTDGSDEWVGLP